jgi:NAD(P)-dependent dehydrogenase (short-subunit alcohol dehydrogenase family)
VATFARSAAETGLTELTGDVRKLADVERAVAELGPVDVLVNNAGTLAAIAPLAEADADDWWLDVETSVRGAFNCTRAVLPGMLERGRGTIVNVSSYAAIRPSPNTSGYAAAKAALLNLTETLAAETGGTGVAVFAISPGFVRTAMTDRLLESGLVPGAGSGGAVEAERAGRLVAFLASGAADALSGRFLHVLDDWEELARSADELGRDELYVMRLRRPD